VLSYILIDTLVIEQFRFVQPMEGYGRLTKMCLASILYHRDFISSLDYNHVVRQTSMVLRQEIVVDYMHENPDAILVSRPWEDTTHHFNGIPPHVTTLHELMEVKTEQRGLIDKFMDRMTSLLDERAIGGGMLTEERLREVLTPLVDGIKERLDSMENGVGGLNAAVTRRVVENNDLPERGLQGYQMHVYDGRFNRLPKVWRFPRVGVADAWRQWWIGDSVRNIPPLRHLTSNDVKFLDKIPLEESEKSGRGGRNHEKRRASRKTLHDYKYLMGHVTDRVRELDKLTANITLSSVDAMFMHVAMDYQEEDRDGQKKWTTFVHKVHKKKRRLQSEADAG
jgi:hypothetical protein